MISVEDWVEIRWLQRAEGLPIRQIARVLVISRNTVKAALKSDGPPRYSRRPAGSVADGFEPRIRELLQAYPQMPSTVIADRVGWPYSIRTLSGRVAELRPAYLPPDPAARTAYAAGEIGQCDFWFPPVQVPVGFGQVRSARQLPVLTMVCGYSRWASALLVPSRQAEDLFAGWWAGIEALGAVPRTLVWDGEGAVGRWRGRRSELTAGCQAFRGTLGASVYICQPRDPEAKGLVERFHDYLERSFLPGRTFTSPADFNARLGRVGRHRQHPAPAAPGVRARGPGRRGQGGDDRAAAGGARHRVAAHRQAAARSLRPAGFQRLPGRSAGDRPPHRDHRRPRGSGSSATGSWLPIMTGPGPGTRRSPARRTWRRHASCGPRTGRWPRWAGPRRPRWSSGTWPSATRCATAPERGWREVSAYPAIGEPAVTAAAMRAAAGLAEESGLAGLSVTCTDDHISVQVCTWAGDPAQRAAHVALLAQLAGTHAYQHDSRAGAFSQIQACGQARGIPVTVFTALAVRTRPVGAGPVPLAVAPGGQVTAVPDGQLPAGWRWVTELDGEPAAAAGREVA